MTVSECARYTRDSGNTGSVSVPVTAGVSAGKRLVLAVNGAALNAATSFSATDSQGNTYTQRAFAICSVAAVDGQIAILDANITAALSTSDTITVTCNTRSPDKWCVIGVQADDVSGGFDVAATNTGGTGSSVATGTTGTAAQDDELLIAVIGLTDSGADATLTMTDWTQLAKATASPGSNPKSLFMAYRYVSASGTRSGSGTLPGGSEAWVGAIAAYKQDAPAAQPFCFLFDGTTDIPMDITVS
jgi:hypothetical protein